MASRGWLVAVEDGVHLLGDGHFYAVARGELERGAGGADAFGDLAVHAGEDVGELAAAAELDADGAVAGEGAGAGEDEIAEAGETGESLAVAAAGDGEAGDLGDAAGDDGGAGVVAEVEALNDSGGEGDDVLERAAELDAGDVVVGVDAEGGGGEVALDDLCEGGLGGGDDDGCGNAGGDLLCEGWAAQDGAAVGGDGGDDLGHAQVGGFLEALGGAEDDLVAGEQRGDVGDDAAEMLGGRDAEEDVGFEDGGGEVGGDVDAGGEGEAGEIGEVFAEVVELLGERRGVGPEDDLVAAAAGERDGERGSPGAGAKDGDATQAGTFLAPKRLSVPERRRRMLAWCLTMTSSGMKRKARRTTGSAGREEDGGEERDGERGEDAAERDVTREEEDGDEDEEGTAHGAWGEDEKDAERGGDAFAAAKGEPDREDVAEDGGDGGGGREIECGRAVEAKAMGDGEGDEDGDDALEAIEQKGGDAEAFGAGACDVGCADVAAADRADVLFAEDANEEISEGDRAQKIGDHNGGEPGTHRKQR